MQKTAKRSVMKKTDIQHGATYLVKVAGNLVPVRIIGVLDNGGWEGKSLKTGKSIRIKSAQRFGKLLADASWSTTTPEENRRRHADQAKAVTECLAAGETTMSPGSINDKPKTYKHKLPDGSIVRVTVPEDPEPEELQRDAVRDALAKAREGRS
jgi:hypothetical protein